METDATISDETDKWIGLDSIANHRGETAGQTAYNHLKFPTLKQ